MTTYMKTQNNIKIYIEYMGRKVRKRTFVHVRSANIQVRLRIRAVRSGASFWIAKDARVIHADNEDSDQTARMRKLIWVSVGRTYQKARFLMMRFV